MKKIIYSIFILIIFLHVNLYGLDTGLLDIRNQIFNEARVVKPLIATSPDSVLVSSMWDSCLITVSNIDAYFFMLGIFNNIKDDDLTEETVNYLITWLKRTKAANHINVKSLSDIKDITDGRINVHIQMLQNSFNKLDNLLNTEISKVNAIKKIAKK